MQEGSIVWREDAAREPTRIERAAAPRLPQSLRTTERESARQHNVPAPLTSMIGRAPDPTTSQLNGEACLTDAARTD